MRYYRGADSTSAWRLARSLREYRQLRHVQRRAQMGISNSDRHQVWLNESMLSRLEGMKRIMHVCQQIARKPVACGSTRTFEQYRVKAMHIEFQKVINNNNRQGSSIPIVRLREATNLDYEND